MVAWAERDEVAGTESIMAATHRATDPLATWDRIELDGDSQCTRDFPSLYNCTSVGVDAQGNAAVTWTEDNDGNGQVDVHVSHHGEAWGTPQLLMRDAPDLEHSSGVVVAASGEVVVILGYPEYSDIFRCAPDVSQPCEPAPRLVLHSRFDEPDIVALPGGAVTAVNLVRCRDSCKIQDSFKIQLAVSRSLPPPDN